MGVKALHGEHQNPPKYKHNIFTFYNSYKCTSLFMLMNLFTSISSIFSFLI